MLSPAANAALTTVPMIARYNKTSLAFGVPGIFLQVAGNVMVRTGSSLLFGSLLALVGTALLLAGFAYYAIAKGRHPLWCLLAFLSIIGLVVLVLLPDLAKDGEQPKRKKRSRLSEEVDEGDDRPRRRERHVSDEEIDEEKSEERPPRKRSQQEQEAIVDAEAVVPVVPAVRRVACSSCGKTLKVPSKLIGKKVKCPGCGEIFVA